MEGDQVVPDGPVRLQIVNSFEAELALIRADMINMKMEMKTLSGRVWSLTTAISLLIGTNRASESRIGERSVNANGVSNSSELASAERFGNNDAVAFGSRVILSNDE